MLESFNSNASRQQADACEKYMSNMQCKQMLVMSTQQDKNDRFLIESLSKKYDHIHGLYVSTLASWKMLKVQQRVPVDTGTGGMTDLAWKQVSECSVSAQQ